MCTDRLTGIQRANRLTKMHPGNLFLDEVGGKMREIWKKNIQILVTYA